ncbi:hypothetical protein MMC18_004989 [Xylographa bjoerkii]|nr:hypothetical protein [Xylographa bjoerkii]
MAFGSGYYDSPVHAIIARDLSGLKADLYALERRFAEASFDDEDDYFGGLSARSFDDEDDYFGGLSARSTFDEDEYLDMLLRRAFPSTPTEGQTTRGPQKLDGNLGRVNTKIGQYRNGSEGKTTQDKQNEINRLATNREAGRTNTNRHYVGSLSSPNNDIIPKPNNKLIHFVRHAQGFHNLSYKKHSIRDPLLTPKGRTQCRHVSGTFPAAQQLSIKLLAASPLRRTIYTALYSFPDVVQRGLKIVALPEAQETGSLPCDIGSDPEILEKEFETLPVDLNLVHEGWNSKTGRWAADPNAIRERALFVRRWLRDREEDVICLVSHGGFLHYLNEDWDGFGEAKGTGWANCEWRTYEFKAGVGVGEGDENATLVETQRSRARRRGTEKELGDTEQAELQRTTSRKSEGGRLE